MTRSSSPTLFRHFRMWVMRFRRLKTEQIKEKTGENLSIFTDLVELVARLEPAIC